jgi:RNA polymerase sigma-70 factor (ECF subfamily)
MSTDVARLADDADQSDVDELVARADAEQKRNAIASAVNALPRRERDPLLMHVLGGLSYDQIAIASNIPIGTVRSRISRARNRVATSIRSGDRS